MQNRATRLKNNIANKKRPVLRHPKVYKNLAMAKKK